MNTSQSRTREREVGWSILAGGVTVPRRSRLLRVLIAGLLLMAMVSLVPAGAVQAAKQVPFSGTFVTSGVGTLCGPLTFCFSVTGSGEATHLGRSAISRSIVSRNTLVPCSDVASGTIREFTDTLTLTAANGNQIMLTGSGTSCANGIDVVSSGSYSVAGGTGRLSGASGTLTLNIARFSPDPELTMLTGTIASPGSAKKN
jgi:hypothetical protein